MIATVHFIITKTETILNTGRSLATFFRLNSGSQNENILVENVCGGNALLAVKWSTMNDKAWYGCTAAAADAGSGVGDIRTADERVEPDTQDHVTHAVVVDVRTMPSDACWWHWKGSVKCPRSIFLFTAL